MIHDVLDVHFVPVCALAGSSGGDGASASLDGLKELKLIRVAVRCALSASAPCFWLLLLCCCGLVALFAAVARCV